MPDHSDRLGEGFARRSDAHRFLLWLAGDPLPEHWKIHVHGDGRLAYDVDCGQGYAATLWIRAVRKFFPARADQIVELAAQADHPPSAT